MTDPTPTAGAPETQSPLVVEQTPEDKAYNRGWLDGNAAGLDACQPVIDSLQARLALDAAPEPSLLAAVERDVMKRVAGLGYKTDGGTEVIARSQVYRVIHEAFESRSISREAGLDAEAVTGAARDMRVTADDIYGAIRDLGRAGSRAEAIVFACAEAIAARLAASPVPAENPEPK